MSSRITNKESLGQNWGLSTVSGTGISAGERSTVKSRSRGRAQGQLARRLVTDKLDAHRRLIDTLSETVHTLSPCSIALPFILTNLLTTSFLPTYLPTSPCLYFFITVSFFRLLYYYISSPSSCIFSYPPPSSSSPLNT